MPETLQTTQKPSWRQLTLALTWPADRHVLGLPENMAFTTGVTLMEVRVTRDKEGWRTMVKGNRKDKPLVAFSGGQHWDDALENLLWEAATGNIVWRPDRFPR